MDYKYSCLTCCRSAFIVFGPTGKVYGIECCEKNRRFYGARMLLTRCMSWHTIHNKFRLKLMERVAKKLLEGLQRDTNPNPRTAAGRNYRGTRHGIRKGGTISDDATAQKQKVESRLRDIGYGDTGMPRRTVRDGI